MTEKIEKAAMDYARQVVIPVQAKNKEYSPTVYERGMIVMIARSFLAGARARAHA